MAQAPSEVGLVSRSLMGSTSIFDLRTSPTVMSMGSWAKGLFLAFPRFLTATLADCSTVTPYLYI